MAHKPHEHTNTESHKHKYNTKASNHTEEEKPTRFFRKAGKCRGGCRKLIEKEEISEKWCLQKKRQVKNQLKNEFFSLLH